MESRALTRDRGYFDAATQFGNRRGDDRQSQPRPLPVSFCREGGIEHRIKIITFDPRTGVGDAHAHDRLVGVQSVQVMQPSSA